MIEGSYFQPGENRAASVRDLFDGIAARYDRINDLQSFGLHRRWKRRLLKRAQVCPGEVALDLCCGTGDVTFALARAGALTTGLDFSRPMLDVAMRRRGMEDRHDRTRFKLGDALALKFADEAFDLVTISYGLRNLADLDAGLREMRRVTRPGGRLVVLDFSRPVWPPWRALYFGYLRLAVPLFGGLFAGDRAAYAYILDSLRAFPDAAALKERLTAAGWQNARAEPLGAGIMALHSAER
ncbi:MAG: bifunctional demethylmenaquinone methyltransferase/2-methoxy-6-polyprenyl-1,4-benzoquinol methylase UbiE [Limisphaerales bacterium]